MNDEVKRIMKMVEDGRLSSDEAAELMEAVNQAGTSSDEPESNEPYMGRSVKIRVTSEGKERVRLNVPIKLVKWVLKTGHGIALAIPDAQAYMKDIDLDVILKAIDQHETGKIIDLETEEGEAVMIYIE